MNYIRIIISTLIFGLWGCSYEDQNYDKTIVNGVYASNSGYVIDLREETYSLCKDGTCLDGKVDRKELLYLLDFRGNLPAEERNSLPFFDFINSRDRHNFKKEGYDRKNNMDIELFNHGNNRQYKTQCQLKPCFWLAGYENKEYFFKLQPLGKPFFKSQN